MGLIVKLRSNLIICQIIEWFKYLLFNKSNYLKKSVCNYIFKSFQNQKTRYTQKN